MQPETVAWLDPGVSGQRRLPVADTLHCRCPGDDTVSAHLPEPPSVTSLASFRPKKASFCRVPPAEQQTELEHRLQ